jgi:D-alanyl-D-alanine carboxypeptidase
MTRSALAVIAMLSAMARTTASAQTPASEIVRRTSAHLATLAREDGLSGVVLVAKDGKPVLETAYGFSNLADRVPNRVDTKFNMASMGKMFTAVAVLQLVEAGKITLDDTVGKYLPHYPGTAVRDDVTVKELLTHTSGMGNFWEQLADKAKDRYVSVSDYVPLFADQPLLFEPGKSFAYSNNGYTVLGLIIEAVSGQTYFDYVRDHIYRPCGMTDTDAYELNAPIANLAMGYYRSADTPGQVLSNIYLIPFRGSPAGGSYTTAADLLRFANALMSHKLLDQAYTDALTTGTVDYGTRRYAYGFTVDTVNGHRLIGHGGGNTGIADELMIFTDLGYTVVVLTNGDVENFWEIQNFMRRSLMGPSPASKSYDFTSAAITKVRASGFAAGATMVHDHPDHPPIRAGLMEQIGYKLLWERKPDQAIAVFRLYALAKPQDEYAYLGLGKAYERSSDAGDAIDAYTKYLALEPTDADTKAALDRLKRAAGATHPLFENGSHQ